MAQPVRVCWQCGWLAWTNWDVKRARRRGCPQCGARPLDIITFHQLSEAVKQMQASELKGVHHGNC